MRWAAVIFLAFVVLGSRLMVSADWPASCNPQGRRFQLLEAYWCSPHLLSGGLPEIAAFLFVWTLPISVLALIFYRRQRNGARSAQISVE